MIEGITAVRPGIIPNLFALRGMPGKVAAPVRPINAVYTQFEHVKGIPSENGGVPFFKLRILDNLIDRLLSYGRKEPESGELKRVNGDTIDTLIGGLQARLRTAVTATQPFFGGFYPETGMLIDLVA